MRKKIQMQGLPAGLGLRFAELFLLFCPRPTYKNKDVKNSRKLDRKVGKHEEKEREVSYDPQIFEFLFLIFSITCKKL